MQFDPRNILVIHFGQLGDVVLALPALREIREHFPKARITVAVGKPAGDVIRLSGYCDNVLDVDRVALRDGAKLLSLARIVKLVAQVRKAKYDFVVDLHSLSETNLLGFFSGASNRLYSRRPGRSLDYLANFKPRPPVTDKSAHVVDRYLDVLKPLGIAGRTRMPFLKTNATADAVAEALLRKEKAHSNALLVGLFPGAGHASRRWPLERFAELADFLIRNDRVRVVVFAGPEESALLPQMRALFPPSTIFFDRLSIPNLASMQARLTLFVSNDTGPMHIAAAVGTPVVVVLQQAAPRTFIPVGDQHRIVSGRSIDDVTVAAVYSVAHELLASSRTEKLFSYSEQR